MWGNGMARPAREERLDVRVTQIAAGSAHFVAVSGTCQVTHERARRRIPPPTPPFAACDGAAPADERTRNLFTWGANTYAALLPSAPPPPLSHLLAHRASGAARCVRSGQLGHGDTNRQERPKRVRGSAE